MRPNESICSARDDDDDVDEYVTAEAVVNVVRLNVVIRYGVISFRSPMFSICRRTWSKSTSMTSVHWFPGNNEIDNVMVHFRFHCIVRACVDNRLECVEESRERTRIAYNAADYRHFRLL